MKSGTFYNEAGQKQLPCVWYANTAWSRLRGLIGHAPLNRTEGLFIANCRSVHTCFMGFALDIVYLDKNGMICKIKKNMTPWAFSVCWRAKNTLELAAGSATQLGLEPAQKLVWRTHNA